MKCMRISSQLACALEPMALRVEVEADLGIALLPRPMRALLPTTLALLRPWCLPAENSSLEVWYEFRADSKTNSVPQFSKMADNTFDSK